MAPDKIYIFQDGDELWYNSKDWNTPPPGRVEYIRKDALLEWWMKKFKNSPLPGKTITTYLIEYLESL